MRWRYVLGTCLILYAVLAWWQQSRVIKSANKDREDAITRTSEKVAAETSKQVTKTVSELYSQMISGQKAQIANLETELRSKPIKVEVTNPASVPGSPQTVPTPSPILSGIRIASQRQIPSDEPSLPFGLEVVVQTDVDIAPVKLAILCDGPIGKGRAQFEAAAVYTMERQGLSRGNENIFVAEWETPAWTPQRPIIVRLFSKSAIRAIGLSRSVLD